MPTLEVVNFNIVCATLGGFITLFGLVSYLLKERFYLGEALISTFAGLIASPHATNFIKPLQYANYSEENLEIITLYFSRLVLGVQLVLAGVQLPSKYLWTQRKSLSLLLGPGMCAMWICTSLLVWALVPNIDIVFALAIGSCVTPTDPVLSNSIVKGKFADKNIPPALQKIIIAESGANDGLGYPFLFVALYLLKYVNDGGYGNPGGGGEAMRLWFGETWAYTILLSVVYGAFVGWLAKELLHWAEERHYVDRESFLVFAITLALFIVGTVGMIGSDDVLACFIAGNAFTWDDWFRRETEDDSLQPTIDMLLNVAVFMWYGAVCPWHKFLDNDAIPIYRLILLGILVLMFRRLPIVLLYHHFDLIEQIEDIRHAFFVGFFGPIGVSAVFYIYIAREFLAGVMTPSGEQRADAAHLSECIEVIVWFLVICSIVVHGLSIPVGKVGVHLPRTISTAISTERTSRSMTRDEHSRPVSPAISQPGTSRHEEWILQRAFARRRPTTSEIGAASDMPSSFLIFPRALLRTVRDLLARINTSGQDSNSGSSDHERTGRKQASALRGPPRQLSISGPMDPRPIGHTIDPDTPPLSAASSARRMGHNSDTASPALSGLASPRAIGPTLESGSPTLSGTASPRKPLSGLATPASLRTQSPNPSSFQGSGNWRANRSIAFADEPRSLASDEEVSDRKMGRVEETDVEDV